PFRTLLEFVPGCAVNNYIGSGHEVRLISHLRRQSTDLLKPPRVLKSVTSSHLTATPRAVRTIEMHNVFRHRSGRPQRVPNFWKKLNNGSYKGKRYATLSERKSWKLTAASLSSSSPSIGGLKSNSSSPTHSISSTTSPCFHTHETRQGQSTPRTKEKKCKTKFRVEKAQFTKCKNKDEKQRMIAKHLELLDDAIKITETYNIRLARNFFGIFMSPRWASQLAALPENWEAEVENDEFIDDEVEEEEVSESTNSEEDRYNSEFHDLDMDDYDL
ncbi:unnamed protein product, partial [Aureobasidium pullulans]